MAERRSVWHASADPGPDHPPLQQDLDVDVVVVGGGITGLTTALFAQRDGARVALLEARQIGAGTTGGTTGKVTSQHGLAYRQLIDSQGTDRARQYAQANQYAVGAVGEIAAALDDDCQLTEADAFVYSLDEADVSRLREEAEAASTLGLPASFETETDLPFPVAGAVRFTGQAHFHAVRYVKALARLIVAGGGQVFEGTRVLKVEDEDGRVTLETTGGSVQAGHAVLATLLPFDDRGGFFAKAHPVRAYGVAAHLASSPPAGMHISVGGPTRSTRPWWDGDRPGLIVVGEEHKTGEGDASPARWGELERWARDNFDVTDFAYRWSAQDYLPVDDVPFVGRSPRSGQIFVATGMRKWGLTNGTAAGRILADVMADRPNPWAEVFDATRVGDAGALKDLIKENVKVAGHMVGGWVGRLTASSVEKLEPGQADIVRVDGRAVGAYRSADGTVEAVGLTCTHLGCTVGWNDAEKTWDCPCHGSRFGTDGRNLEGPAVEPLPRVEVES